MNDKTRAKRHYKGYLEQKKKVVESHNRLPADSKCHLNAMTTPTSQLSATSANNVLLYLIYNTPTSK